MGDYVPEYKCKKRLKATNAWIEQLLLKNEKTQKRLDRIEKQLGLKPLPDNWSEDDIVES